MAKIDILTRLFEDAEQELGEVLQSIIVRAYEEGYGRGLFEGRKIGMADYHGRLKHILSKKLIENAELDDGVEVEIIKTPSQEDITRAMAKEATQRSPYGTVEKLVLRALNDASQGGLNGKEITERIHGLGYYTVKQPSVRGRLRKLLAEGKVIKEGKLWRIKEYDL